MGNDILNELAELASKHKLVPFLGAGCSASQLNYDWDKIIDELREDIDSNIEDHLEVAQRYVELHGKDQLCNFLEDRFLIETFDDSKGCTNLAIMSLGLGVVYTTNQDNVMEKCFQKYGRTYSKIVELEDLGNSTPGDKLYFKFHGDLSKCDSVVFSTEDYTKRIDDEDNFLNIRLRADLLAKSLLFVGYSLRDENIKLILEELTTAFKNKLPPAYMIAWEYSAELEELCNNHGIELIDPLKVFPDSKDNSEAFDRFLRNLVEKTFFLKEDMESELLRSAVPITNRVVCKFEVDSLQKIVEEKDFDESCKKFRAIMDLSHVPEDFEPIVIDIFKKLSIKCSNSHESDDLNDAGFALLLSPKSQYNALIYLMATANVRDRIDTFNPNIGGITGINGTKPELYVISIPDAIRFIIDNDNPITDAFRANVSKWIDQSVDIENFNHDDRLSIKEWVDKAWEGCTTLEHPLKRKKPLKGVDSPFKARSAEEIFRSMMGKLPKTGNRPFEE